MSNFNVIIEGSGKHCHLKKETVEALFGEGFELEVKKMLSQPGQFATPHKITVVGPKRSTELSILGPFRPIDQVELSLTDARAIGLEPPIRESGDIKGTPGCKLVGPAGTITIGQGVMVAARHAHFSVPQAEAYGIKDGEMIYLKTPAPREGIIGNIIARVGKEYNLDVHLDTDEANGNGILCGTILEGLKPAGQIFQTALAGAGSSASKHAAAGASEPALELVTERDINKAITLDKKIIYYSAKGFVSPAAADRAKEKGIELCKLRV